MATTKRQLGRCLFCAGAVERFRLVEERWTPTAELHRLWPHAEGGRLDCPTRTDLGRGRCGFGSGADPASPCDDGVRGVWIHRAARRQSSTRRGPRCASPTRGNGLLEGPVEVRPGRLAEEGPGRRPMSMQELCLLTACAVPWRPTVPTSRPWPSIYAPVATASTSRCFPQSPPIALRRAPSGFVRRLERHDAPSTLPDRPHGLLRAAAAPFERTRGTSSLSWSRACNSPRG